MKVRPLLIGTILLAALMAAFALWAAGQVPAGAELPVHWNAAGEVDDTMPALPALLMPPGLALALGLLFAIIPAIEPLQDRLEGSAPLLRASWLGTLGLLVAVQCFIAAPILGLEPGPSAIVILVGILFLVLGNMMPKSRPGFFVGIRTPWTITDADNWIATHRLAGKLFLAAGLAMIAAGVIDMPGELRMVLVLGAALGAGLIPAVYSWHLWNTGRRGRGAN